MVTVPTAQDLPSVAPTAPQISPQQGIDRVQRSDLEAPGEGEHAVGEGLIKDAAVAAGVAAAMDKQANDNASKAAATQHQGYTNNLLYQDTGSNPNGPDGGLYSLKGQAFVDAAPKVTAAIQAQRDQTAQFGMPGPDGQLQALSSTAQRSFVAQTDPEIQAATGKIMANTVLQSQAAANDVSNARIQGAGTNAVLNYNDTSQLDGSSRTVASEVADQARREGGVPADVLASRTTSAVSSTILRPAIEKALSDTSAAGPPTLANLWNKYQGQLSPTDNVILADRVRGPLLEYHATQRVQQLGGQASTGGMDQPYQQGAGYYDAVHGGEGNGVNGTTGASGPVQVIPSTARAFAASPQGQGVDVNTEAGARQFTKWYGDQNAQQISATTGQPATMGQVVAAHLLGPGGATAIIAHPNEPIGNFLSADAIKNNPGPLPNPNATGSEALASINSYYSKASGNQFAGPGAPAGTAVTTTTGATVPPPIRPDFEGMLNQEQASADDPALKTLVMDKIAANLHQFNLGQTTNRAASEKQFGDTLTALENGATTTPIPTLAYAQTHSPAEVEEFNRKIADSTAFGSLRNSLQFAAPDQVNAQVAAAQAKIDGARPGPNGEAPTAPLSAEDMATAARHVAMLQQVAKANAEAMNADPATYVARNPIVAAAMTAVTRAAAEPEMSPTERAEVAARAVQTSLRVQAQLGVASPQAISTPSIEKLSASIAAAKPEALPGIIDGLRGQYGSAFPDVWRDLSDPKRGKVNPDFLPLATMNPTGPGRVDYAAALKDRSEKGADFGQAGQAQFGKTTKADIETGITTALGPMADSFKGASGDTAIDGARSQIRTLATYYTDHGMKAADAVDAAYGRIIGDQYDVSGSVRAPRSINGQPFSADKVIQAGAGVTAGLTDAGLQRDDNGKIVTTANQAQAGTWVTNQDGKGVTLQVQNASGTWKTVRRADGSPIALDYYKPLPPPTLAGANTLVGAGMNAVPGISQ